MLWWTPFGPPMKRFFMTVFQGHHSVLDSHVKYSK